MKNKFKLNINEYLTQCDPKDIISFESEKWVSVSKLKDIIYQSFSWQGVISSVNHISKNIE